MSYTSVFGGNTIYPADVSYVEITLAADTTFEWPLEAQGTTPVLARIMDVQPTVAGRSIILPDATLTGAGQTVLFNNTGVAEAFFVKNNAGATLATIAVGEQWQLYLTDTSTAAGQWQVFRFGASTATVQPSSLAGFGLTVTASSLSQEWPVTTFSMSGLTLGTSARASTYIWTGTGVGTLNLPNPSVAGAAFFLAVRNSGGGTLTVASVGAATIDGIATLILQPGDSTILMTDGAVWYTVGKGQQAVFAFDHTVINLTGNYTLAAAELNRISYKFTGNLTADATVTVPATVQQYWITNATTGPGALYMKVQGGGLPLLIPKGASSIYYSDSVDFIRAADPSTIATPVGISDGGTGATTASAARLNLGITPFADGIVTATDATSVRTIILAARSGANSDITSLSGLTTPISVAQGGTGATTAASARTNLGLGTMATQNAGAVAITGGTLSSVTITGATLSGGPGSFTTLAASGLATLSGGVSTTSITGMTTPLSVGQGGTGANNAAGARTNLGLGTMATQDASAVAITGGTIASVTITGATISGGSGSFTSVTSSSFVNATGAVAGSALNLNVGNASFAPDGSNNPTLTVDANDALVYQRATDTFNFITGGSSRAQVSPTGLVVLGLADVAGRVTGLSADSGTGGLETRAGPTSGVAIVRFLNNAYNSVFGSLSTTSSQILRWNNAVVWTDANDGSGSGLDAGLLEGQNAAYYTNIIARLGYTPVQQGTGVGQLGNAIKIGWSGTRVKVTVDSTDQGNVTTDTVLNGGLIPVNGTVMNRNGNTLYGPDNLNLSLYPTLAASNAFTGGTNSFMAVRVVTPNGGVGGLDLLGRPSDNAAILRFINNANSVEYGQFNSVGSGTINWSGTALTIGGTAVPKSARSTSNTVNITDGTAAPSGGNNGDIYFQYT